MNAIGPNAQRIHHSRFFETTPQELIAGGLYKDLALACYPGLHREVSLRLLAKALGAKAHGATSIRQRVVELSRGAVRALQLFGPAPAPERASVGVEVP